MFYEYMIGIYYKDFEEYKEYHGVVYINKDSVDPYLEAHNKILKFYKDDEDEIRELHLAITEEFSVPVYEFPEDPFDFDVHMFKVKIVKED